MKTLSVVIAFVLLIVACKKREENPTVISPNVENVRITEIIDSNITRDSLEQHKRFYYDAQGRISKIESFGRYPYVQNYSYEMGRLSSISSIQSDGSRFVRTFARENGQIITVSRQRNGTLGYTDTYSYDEEGHLLKWTEWDNQSNTGDSTLYSEFEQGRYSRSFKSFKLKFMEDAVAQSFIQKELKSFDEEGRILSYQQTLIRSRQIDYGDEPRYGDSSGIETRYDYFPLSELQRKMVARQREINKNYYSDNADVLEQLLDPSLSLPNLYQASRKTYTNGHILEQSTSVIEKTDGLGLPVSILTTRTEAGFGDPPFIPFPTSTIRRTIRYEID